MKLLTVLLAFFIGTQIVYCQQVTLKEVPGMYKIATMSIEGKPVYSRADSSVMINHFLASLKADNSNYTKEDSLKTITKAVKKGKKQGEFYIHLLDNGVAETPEKSETDKYVGWKFDEAKQEVALTLANGKTEANKIGLVNNKVTLTIVHNGDFLNMVIELVKE